MEHIGDKITKKNTDHAKIKKQLHKCMAVFKALYVYIYK